MAEPDWKFLGEGGANVVLAYVGSEDELAGAVLRVRKAGSAGDPSKQDESDSALLKELWHGQFEWSEDPVEREVRYVRDYLGPKLGDVYAQSGAIVPMPEAATKVLNAHGRQQAENTSALLIDNHTTFAGGVPGHEPVGPVVCVELKTKCGFVPDSPFISQENALKLQYPRFLLHQFLNHTKKGITFCSYNPVDLFSNEAERVLKALTALLDVPNNNLRIFKDGELVFGGRPIAGDAHGQGAYAEADASQAGLNDALSDFAVGPPADGAAGAAAPNGTTASPGAHVMRIMQQVLQESGVLQGLLDVQRLDTLDIEAIAPLYERLQKEPSNSAATAAPAGMAAEQAAKLAAMPRTEALLAVRNYLAAATAKDCSVMCTIQQVVDRTAPGDDGQRVLKRSRVELGTSQTGAAAAFQLPPQVIKTVVEAETGLKYMFKVAFVDLDIKHPSKIHQHLELDTRIMHTVNKDAEKFLKLVS